MFRKARPAIFTWAAAALIAFSLLLTGCAGLFPAEEEELAPPLIKPETITYETVKARRGTLTEQVRLTGNFCAENEVALSFTRTSGRLKTIKVMSGSDVTAGELLAELDSDSLSSSIRLQEIEVEKYKLNLSHLKASGADSYSIKRASLDLEQQEIRLEDLQNQLDATRILAPMDGQVTYVISTAVGDPVSAYQTVVRISDVSRMNVQTKATEATQLPLGAAVSIEYRDAVLTGEVIANPASLAGDPDQEMRKSAIISLDSPIPADAGLGQSVMIYYIKQQRDDVLILSRSHVNLLSGRYFVNVLENGVRVEKDVEIGLMTATEVEIISGISEDDLIITN